MTMPEPASRRTLSATPAMRAAVLDEAELAGLPPRVQVCVFPIAYST